MLGRLFSCLLFASLVCACGPDERQTNNIRTNGNPNNTTTMTSNNSTNVPLNSGFGEECVGVECDAGLRCVAGQCVAADSLVSCEDFDDLGVLTFGDTYMGTGDTSAYVDAIATTCSDVEASSGAENAIMFTVEEAGRARFTLTSAATFTWVIEMRGACDDPGDLTIVEPNNEPVGLPPALCTTTPTISFAVRPDREYWLIAEPFAGTGKGAFEWTLELEQSACAIGRTCQDETTILQCFAGVEERVLSCGTSCMDGVCQGDSCENAVTVTASMSWSGDADAFSNTLDFASQPSCSVDGVEGIPTPGPDMVLAVPGLTAGQTVTIDASMMDDNDNGIFVLDTCSDTAGCLAAKDLGDILTFDVPADGDYYFVIDKLTSSLHTFNYTIDIQ